MSFWTVLNGDEKERIEPYLKNTTFDKGACIFEENDSAKGCYILMEEVVRLEIQHSETESDNVLGHLEAGQLLGEFSLVEPSARSASAYAETAVKAKWMSTYTYHQIGIDLPNIGFKIANALITELSEKIRKQNVVLAGYLSLEEVDSSTDTMVKRAKSSRTEFADLSEEKVVQSKKFDNGIICGS